jgi:hypothetical protein
MSFSDLRLARLMASLRGGCARVRAIHPSSSSRVSRLEEPGHDCLGGRGLGASWWFARSRPPKAPHGLLLARPRQGPMPRCNSESNDVADGIEDMEFTDVKDCEERADRPPKSPGRRVSGLSRGRISSSPRQLWGPRPGGLLARPAGGPMKGSSPEAHVR